MTNQEAIKSLRENYCCNRVVCELHGVDLCQKEKCEIWMAISALQAQEPIKTCGTCRHFPPSKKWPCVDCDLRDPADRWEQDTTNTEKMQQTCNLSCNKLQQVATNSKESKTEDTCLSGSDQDVKKADFSQRNSSISQGLVNDLISRQAAIEAIAKAIPVNPMKNDYTQGISVGLGMAETMIEGVPSVQPEIIHCKECSFSDGRQIADGRCWCNITHAYMHYCSDAERRTDESD